MRSLAACGSTPFGDVVRDKRRERALRLAAEK